MTDQTDPVLTVRAMTRFGLSPYDNQDIADFLAAYEEGSSRRRPIQTRHLEAAKAVSDRRAQAAEAKNLLGPDGKKKLSGQEMISIGYQEGSPTIGKPPDNPDKPAIDHLVEAYT